MTDRALRAVLRKARGQSPAEPEPEPLADHDPRSLLLVGKYVDCEAFAACNGFFITSQWFHVKDWSDLLAHPKNSMIVFIGYMDKRERGIHGAAHERGLSIYRAEDPTRHPELWPP